MLQYETDAEAIPPLLPEPYKPGKTPLVTVLFIDNNGVDFMAGGGYRFASISVDASFDGEKGHLEGNYVLAMPENATMPIITGREWLGMPKFFTDISSIRLMDDGHLRCETSLWGHLLFGIDIVPPLKEQNARFAGLPAPRSTSRRHSDTSILPRSMDPRMPIIRPSCGVKPNFPSYGLGRPASSISVVHRNRTLDISSLSSTR